MKLTKLEAIRGFAAVYVVFHHAFSKGLLIGGRDFSVIFRFGQEAVILFFLLSGFVIRYAYERSKDKSFTTFFLKRFLRIYIPLLLVFAADYVLQSVYNGGAIPINWGTLGGNLLMLQDSSTLKPNVICGQFLGNQPLWSLSYEWWFYMIFIGIMLAVKKTKRLSLYVYIAGTLSALTYLFYPNFINREVMYLVIWWAGSDLAILYLNRQKMTLGTMRVPLAALLVNMLILTLNVRMHNYHVSVGYSPYLELRHFSFALVSVLAAIGWNRLKWVGFDRTLGLFEPIASISFGIYITHWFLIVRAHYLDGIIQQPVLRFLLYTVGCLLFSYLLERVVYVWLNKRIMNAYFSRKALSSPSNRIPVSPVN